jgi:alpha-beta hydrolase superfamily lysophospholipase
MPTVAKNPSSSPHGADAPTTALGRSPRVTRSTWLSLATALVVAVGSLAGCATLEEKQREWIFQPSKNTWWASAHAAEGMRDEWIEFVSPSSGQPVRLHALWHASEQADAPVLLYLHGARWDVRGSAPRIRRMQELGFSVLAVDYRGFGRSTDALPSEESADEDAHAAWRWLAHTYPTSRRYIFGHSLGGAIAVRLAAEVTDEAGLIVEGGFTSIPDVVSTFKWGWLPVSALISQRFDAASRIAGVGSPVLVVHGSEDRLINPELARALFERAPQPKRFVLVEGGSHHNTNSIGQGLYRQALRELFGLAT